MYWGVNARENSTMTILVAGIEGQDKEPGNPVQKILDYLIHQNYPDIVAKVLPHNYEQTKDNVLSVTEEQEIKAILLIGFENRHKEIVLERHAHFESAIHTEGGGLLLIQHDIFICPMLYHSTLPLETIFKAIKSKNIPVKFSKINFDYLCNRVTYSVMHHLEMNRREDTPCGFIHVPDVTAVSVEKQIKAIELCIEILETKYAKTN